MDSGRKGNQAGKGRCPVNQTSAAIRVNLVMVTNWRLFLEGSSTGQVPCVFLATPLAVVPLDQCHSNSWPAKLQQQIVPN